MFNIYFVDEVEWEKKVEGLIKRKVVWLLDLMFFLNEFFFKKLFLWLQLDGYFGQLMRVIFCGLFCFIYCLYYGCQGWKYL